MGRLIQRDGEGCTNVCVVVTMAVSYSCLDHFSRPYGLCGQPKAGAHPLPCHGAEGVHRLLRQGAVEIQEGSLACPPCSLGLPASVTCGGSLLQTTLLFRSHLRAYYNLMYILDCRAGAFELPTAAACRRRILERGGRQRQSGNGGRERGAVAVIGAGSRPVERQGRRQAQCQDVSRSAWGERATHSCEQLDGWLERVYQVRGRQLKVVRRRGLSSGREGSRQVKCQDVP